MKCFCNKITYFTTYPATPPIRPNLKNFPTHTAKMAAIAANEDIPYETRFNLALQPIQLSQVPDIRAAAALYNIPRIKVKDQEYQHATGL